MATQTQEPQVSRRPKRSVALYMFYYNFIRIHQSLRMTPAMAAGLTDTLHDLEWLAEQIEAAQPKPKRPKTYKPREKPCT